MEYGVNVSNKFAFLSGDEDVHDPDELISKVEQAKKEKASVLKKDIKKSVEKKVTIAAPVNSISNKENVDNRRPPRRDGPPRTQFKGVRGPPNRFSDESRNGGGAVSGDRPPRNFSYRPPRDGLRFNNNNAADRSNQGPRQLRGPRPTRPEDSGENVIDENHINGENRQINESNRPATNRFRGPRVDRASGHRGDRFSGSDKTGVRSIPKKDGFGRGNWGTENDELVGAENINADASLNQPINNTEKTENVNGHVDDEKSDADLEVEPIRELTLEEYKATHKSEQPNFNIRKPGEGGDKKIYQKLVPLKKVVDKKVDGTDEDVQVKREPREKALNIEVSFIDSQRNRGGRGFRDDRRGDGFRDSGRNGEDRRGGGHDRRQGVNRPPVSLSGPSSSRRNQQGGSFNLTAESFPALGSR